MLAEGDAHLVALDASEGRRIGPLPFRFESQLAGVVGDGCGNVFDIPDRNGGFKAVHISLLRVGASGDQQLGNRRVCRRTY